MRLSEAIRLGAMIRPQGYGVLMQNGKSCALGAAYETVGEPTDKGVKIYSIHMFDGIPKGELAHPVTLNPRAGRLVSVIFSLNDTHRWTRERIADWVESEEIKYAASQQKVEKEETVCV